MHAHEEPTTHENVTHTNQHHDMGPGDKEEDDQHIPPLPTEVVTAQLPPPSPIKKLVFKYHVRGPPPPTKEVKMSWMMRWWAHLGTRIERPRVMRNKGEAHSPYHNKGEPVCIAKETTTFLLSLILTH